MKTTWGEIKKRCTDLGFADEIDYEEHEDKYPAAANYALLNLAATIAPIKKKYTLTQMPLKNLLQGGNVNFDIRAKGNDDIIIGTAINPKAYYYECDGTGIAMLQKYDENTDEFIDVKEIRMGADRSFEAFAGVIDDDGEYRLILTGSNAYNYRNTAFYDRIYSRSPDDVPAYSQWIKYDISELTAGSSGKTFMRFSQEANGVIRKANYPDGYSRHINYFIEGDNSIVLHRDEVGEYDIYYEAYPSKITEKTSDSAQIDISAEAAAMVPLLMAYHIWLDEDSTKATQYFNEYQILKMELIKPLKTKTTDVWESAKGWW